MKLNAARERVWWQGEPEVEERACGGCESEKSIFENGVIESAKLGSGREYAGRVAERVNRARFRVVGEPGSLQ